MSMARQQAEWAQTGVVAAAAHTAFGGGKFNPLLFIPPAFRPDAQEKTRPKTAEELESESKRAWAILDRVFGKKR